MAYASWSVVFGEQPSAAKWNILGTNDAYFSSLLDATGMPLQVVGNATSAVSTGTTAIPLDDTIPQNTEGDQYLTQAITPKSATNILVIETILFGALSAAVTDVIIALFQDSTANALAANSVTCAGSNYRIQLSLRHVMTAGTTSATTFKIRAGGTTGTLTVNGHSATRDFGAIPKSSLKITEYKT